MFTKEMQRALEADGHKLRQLTDKDHGPDFMGDFRDWKSDERRACDCGSFNIRYCWVAPRGVRIQEYVCDDCGFKWFE